MRCCVVPQSIFNLGQLSGEREGDGLRLSVGRTKVLVRPRRRRDAAFSFVMFVQQKKVEAKLSDQTRTDDY